MARDKAMHKLNRMNTCKSPIRPVYPVGHAAVNIFMLTVAANDALPNRLIPITLPNVPFWSPNTGRFTLCHGAYGETGAAGRLLNCIFASMPECGFILG